MIRCETITMTSGATGAGTVVSKWPLSGEILSIRMSGTALNGLGSTADFTFTRQNDGGTVLAVSNVDAPWQYQPREASHTVTGGTTGYSLGVGPVLTHGVPIDDYLVCVVAQGGSAASAAAYVYYEDTRH